MAERVLVSLEDITLRYGGKPLFEDLRVHVCDRDRICLIGKNGAGKTTLMRLLAGELELDAGKRFIYPGLRVGYLAQSVDFEETQTIKSFVLSGLPKQEQTEAHHHLADMIMWPLELDGEALMGTLSGGQVRRTALAQALVAEPDLLMLDEPTNHLDLAAIEWLEGYLSQYRGAVICVSHDRAFLKAVSQKVFWIDRGKIRTCPGGYKNFDEWQEQIIEHESRELHNMQKKMEAELDWTQGGVSGRRKRNIRRMNELHRLRDKLRAEKSAQSLRKQSIKLEEQGHVQASKVVVEFKQVCKSFTRDDTKITILDDFDYQIVRGDRIGILGHNGSGKSTFIKLLMGEIEQDSGHIRRGKTLEIAYFDQSRTDLDVNKRVWDTLCPNGGDYVFLGSGDNQKNVHVCGYLKNFLFDPRIARDRVGTLSGGQQNRLLLAKLLANPGNVLILDEPTNDLDMDTLDMLQEIINDYAGTLILVSHDRDFLDRTVTEVLAFEGDGEIISHIGGYTDYINDKAAREKQAKGKSDSAAAQKAEAVPEKKPLKKLTFKLKHELENLPDKIDALHSEIAALVQQLEDPQLYTRDAALFDTISAKLAEAQHALNSAENRWLELEAMQTEAS